MIHLIQSIFYQPIFYSLSWQPPEETRHIKIKTAEKKKKSVTEVKLRKAKVTAVIRRSARS